MICASGMLVLWKKKAAGKAEAVRFCGVNTRARLTKLQLSGLLPATTSAIPKSTALFAMPYHLAR